MRKPPQPFYREQTKSWYVQLGKRQISLGVDKTEAWAEYHRIMASEGRDVPTRRTRGLTVAEVKRLFLDYCKAHRSHGTWQFYRDRLEGLEDVVGYLAAMQFKPHHVYTWQATKTTHGDTTKNNNARAVQRMLNWAVDSGYIDKRPFVKLDKPKPKRGRKPIDADKYARILDALKTQEHRDLFVAAWETGARPQELTHVEARHVKGETWEFPGDEAKGGRERTIQLTPTVMEITKRLAEQWPSGPLFRNTKGRPWGRMSLKCLYDRLERRTGIRLCLYTLRHSWATRAIVNGVDILSVSKLMGHSDVNMVAEVYGHPETHPGHLAPMMRKASGVQGPPVQS